MRTLSCAEVGRFNEAALLVHRTRSAEEFSSHLLGAMRKVLSADICVVDWYGFQGLDVRTVYDPMDAVPAGVNQSLHLHAHQNPVYEQCRGSVGAISDFLTRKQWHLTDLYAEGFSQVEQEDALVLDISLRKDCRVSLISSRAKRGFAANERALMALLEPHLREVFSRLQLQQRLARSLDEDACLEDVPLSVREREVLRWLAEGKRNSEIAFLLEISPGTVKKHLENIYTKLGVESRHAAALVAVRLCL